MRHVRGPIGVGIGVVVWVGSVDVGVGLAMSCCVGGADADFVGASSLMMSIGEGSVSESVSRGRRPELR